MSTSAPPPAGQALALALTLIAILAPRAPGAAVAPPALAPPWADSSGIIHWTPRPGAPAPADRRLRPGEHTAADSLRFWGALAGDSVLRPFALYRYGMALAAAGDGVAADSALRTVAAIVSPWQANATLAWVDLMMAHGEPWRADRLLARRYADWPRWPLIGPVPPSPEDSFAVDVPWTIGCPMLSDTDGFLPDSVSPPPVWATWPVAADSALRARGAMIRAAMGDTAGALALVNPSSGPARVLLGRLVAAFDGRFEVARPEEPAIAALVRRARGLLRPPPAAAAQKPDLAWARDLMGRLPGLTSAREAERQLRALAEAIGDARDTHSRVVLMLNRVRLLGQLRRQSEALAVLDAADSVLTRPGEPYQAGLHTSLWLRRGQTLEELQDWRGAGAAYDSVGLGLPRSFEARGRMALLAIAEGNRDSALAWAPYIEPEARTFWQAVLLRSKALMPGDLMLRDLALSPGYSFYQVAARESLGLSGWPGGEVAAAVPASDTTLALIQALLDIGEPREAAALIAAWHMNVLQSARVHRGRVAGGVAWLEAARLAYAAGRSRKAIELLASADDRIAGTRDWGLAPWWFPPVYDDLFRERPATASGAPDDCLLRALTWQESRFDAEARSRSDALGLMQLKLDTARELARGLGDHPPAESDLLDPARNVRYGARYLGEQLRRFDGDTILAIAAYNAGPGAVRRFWEAGGRELRARGGDALLCELIVRPETQNYVKKILAARRAYRELRPTTDPR